MGNVRPILSYMKKHRLSQKKFGKLIGVSQVMVSQWLTGRRPIGAERADKIEKKTGGELTRRSLRPDLFAGDAA